LRAEAVPEAYLTASGGELFRAYTWLKLHQIWPVSGGIIDQPAKFVAVVEYCDLVNQTYMKRKREISETNAALYKSMKK